MFMTRPLDIPLLRTFVSLVEERSVTRVAHRLGRTQPAVSLQIRRLEEAAGRALFEPDLRRLRLTRHGEMLLGYARDILRTHEEARVRLAAEEIAGRVLWDVLIFTRRSCCHRRWQVFAPPIRMSR